MDLHSVVSSEIKSEVVLTQTFSFCGKYEDCGGQELKTEPEDYEESCKCKEYNAVEYMDADAGPICNCNECNFTTMERDSLKEHLKINNNVQYSCEKCNFKTQLECSKKEHLRIHNHVDDKHIEECNFKTPQLKTPNVNVYICNECNYTTLKKNYLREHVKIHTGHEYKCKECNYKTVWKICLKEHVKIHTGHEYKYKECDYKTAWENNLKQPVKIHAGVEYMCKECDYKTVQKRNLNQHVKIHTGVEYKCKDCDYKTMQKRNLNQHVKIHTGVKYMCKECDYETVWKGLLMQHVKIHTGTEHKCKECGYKTARKNQLKAHIRIHTGDEHKCKECDYKTVWKGLLTQHVKIHTGEVYNCKECDYKTVQKHLLKKHLKIHAGVEYKCKECDYKTVWKCLLKQHVKIHMGDEFKCNECDYKTPRKSCLISHMKRHNAALKFEANILEIEKQMLKSASQFLSLFIAQRRRRFPTKESLWSLWLQACNLTPDDKVNSLTICSLHFKENDFVDLNAKTFGGIIRLQLNAVLSLSVRCNTSAAIHISGPSKQLNVSFTTAGNNTSNKIIVQSLTPSSIAQKKTIKPEIVTATVDKYASTVVDRTNVVEPSICVIEEVLYNEDPMETGIHFRRRSVYTKLNNVLEHKMNYTGIHKTISSSILAKYCSIVKRDSSLGPFHSRTSAILAEADSKNGILGSLLIAMISWPNLRFDG
ncbi:hypothetical protein FQA39_LY05715 [Lamprigera yunnana]|nr:hypothetical protein FQA39_LY05715 [Lamprigera yunnana]